MAFSAVSRILPLPMLAVIVPHFVLTFADDLGGDRHGVSVEMVVPLADQVKVDFIFRVLREMLESDSCSAL